MVNKKTLRLILGDQLNINHSWYNSVDHNISYVIMEVKSESEYVTHHIQKVVGFFVAMRAFAKTLEQQGHHVIYLKINDANNHHNFIDNLNGFIKTYNIEHFEYQEPDEFRVDQILSEFCKNLSISSLAYSSEHFYTSRYEMKEMFAGKKTYLMESFYRKIRTKHGVLMEGEKGDKPYTGQWNYDADNRKKLPVGHRATAPLIFEKDVSSIVTEITQASIKTIGNIDPKAFIWPINKIESEQLLTFFCTTCLANFGTYQDALSNEDWSLYHARLSFSMNLKLISPKQVIDTVINYFFANQNTINYNQVEGFVRQIIGWREYMRGIYWAEMPNFANLNFFEHKQELPSWFWTGNTKMNCVKHAINQSLNYAYAHHIQRLMITGNFALLAGINPSELDQWYLGIYIDAIEWVEITNTRGMSQFADGGIVGSKPYVSSAAYIDKQGHYCSTCFYKKTEKIGPKACPFNSLYWHFYAKNEDKLRKNPRIGMMYVTWDKMNPETKKEILAQAQSHLKNIENL